MSDEIPAQYGSAIAEDSRVSWHCGNPLAEQRSLLSGQARVDLSHFGVLRVTGSGRLAWLHLLLTQAVENLPPHESVHALVLSATGHIEHDIKLVDDGQATWLIVEPGTEQSLHTYLQSMVFLHDVSIAVVSDDYAVVGAMSAPSVSGNLNFDDAQAVWLAPQSLAEMQSDPDPYVPLRPGAWPAVLAVVPRGGDSHARCEAGMWAWEAARAAAAVPRLGLDIDHRTLPHEVGLIGSAVHLHKGCYRGQEAVARTINLGRPPRRLVLLHLDGSSEVPPATGSVVCDETGREVGLLGTAVVHHELGHIGLAVVRRATPLDAPLRITTSDGTVVSAAQEPVVVVNDDQRAH